MGKAMLLQKFLRSGSFNSGDVFCSPYLSSESWKRGKDQGNVTCELQSGVYRFKLKIFPEIFWLEVCEEHKCALKHLTVRICGNSSH